MKKGFTLIELLAVIVILAIIALIATPIVLGIINDSKNSATIRSAGYYIEAVKHAIMKKNLELQVPIDPKECTVIPNSYIKCDEVELEVEAEGELPDSGSITFESGKTINVELVYGDRIVIKNSNGELVLEKGEVPPKLAPGLYDENDNLVVTWDELTSMDYQTITHVVYKDYEEMIIDSPILSVDENGVLTTAYNYLTNENASSEYLKGKLVIDESVTEIGDYAFKDCTNLISVIIGSGVRIIGQFAFEECSSLTNIKIENGITTIGKNAFWRCLGLYSIVIPDSVTYIGESAFMMCTSLTSITVSSSVTTIDSYAFSECENLTTINYTGTKEEWNLIEFGDYWDKYTPENKVINYNYTG